MTGLKKEVKQIKAKKGRVVVPKDLSVSLSCLGLTLVFLHGVHECFFMTVKLTGSCFLSLFSFHSG